ncbi:MAG: tetratricopeptide repeat protein, partial [Gemmatimonadetes bacterium]|nr:tetratricopeptide repeat protein [Gemmatimonadota bacterium]
PDVVYNLAVLHRKEGELRQAADAFGRVVELDASREAAYIDLARVLIEDGRYNPARMVLMSFVERFPRSGNLENAQTALRELAQMGPGRP